MGWLPMATIVGVVERPGAALTLTVGRDPSDSRWLVMAVEALRPTATPPEQAMAALLAHHSHAFLPAQPTLASALRTAEAYARRWRRSGAAAERCGRGEIGARPPRTRQVARPGKPNPESP